MSSSAETLAKYTAEEVALHSNKDSLWLVFEDKVYDVTSFLVEHPGGEEVLLKNAGIDATEAFEALGHSPDAREKRNSYLIGELADTPTTTATQTPGQQRCGQCGGCGYLSTLGVVGVGAAAVVIAAVIIYRYRAR